MKFLVAILLLSAAAPALCARVELGAASESAAPIGPTVAAPTAVAPLGALSLAPALGVSAAPSASLSAPAALAPAVAAPTALAPAAVPVAAAVPEAVGAPEALSAPAADAGPDAVSAGAAAKPSAAPAALPTSAGPTNALRAQLASLALGLDAAAAPGAAADAPQNALEKFWDLVRDRRAPQRDAPLQARLDAGKAFLVKSLDDPLVADRVVRALRAQSVIAPGMNLPPSVILARLRGALAGGRTIRLASPSETGELGPNALAGAKTFADGHVEVLFHPGSAILARAPPALIATTLLHELVHSEFGLGEHAAFFVETSYYRRLIALAPALAADPDAASLESLRRDVIDGTLSQSIVHTYGKKLRRNRDDAAARARVDGRRRARVVAALDEIAALEAAGNWAALDDRAAWLERRLPREEDRQLYFELVNAEVVRLPDGTPFSAVFSRAAAAARAQGEAVRSAGPTDADAPASAAKIQAHLDSVSRPFGRRAAEDAAPAVGGGIRLDGLRTAGYAAAAPYSLLDKADEDAALAEVDAHYADGLSSFLELSQPPSMHSTGETRWDDAKHPRLNALLRPFVARLTAELNQALPGENVKVRDVQLRLEKKSRTADVGVHVDLGGYVTATYSLRGGGTDLYLTAPDGSVRTIRGITHAVAIVTNKEREWATGVPGTVHSAPALELGRMRVVLIVRYYRPGYESKDMPDAVSKRLDEEIKARNQRVRAALERRSRPAPSGGLLDRLRGALR